MGQKPSVRAVKCLYMHSSQAGEEGFLCQSDWKYGCTSLVASTLSWRLLLSFHCLVMNILHGTNGLPGLLLSYIMCCYQGHLPGHLAGVQWLQGYPPTQWDSQMTLILSMQLVRRPRSVQLSSSQCCCWSLIRGDCNWVEPACGYTQSSSGQFCFQLTTVAFLWCCTCSTWSPDNRCIPLTVVVHWHMLPLQPCHLFCFWQFMSSN